MKTKINKKRTSVSKKVLFTLLLFLTAYTSDAKIWYYDINNTGGTQNGSSWATAYRSLSNVGGLPVGDTVWVAKGTYVPFPGTDRTKSFILESKFVFGGFDGTETAISQRNIKANPTILSGDLSGNDGADISLNSTTRTDNAYSVVTIVHRGHATRMDGFIIEGGHSNASAPGPNRYGGGLYIGSGFGANLADSLLITNCVFRNNSASSGSAFCMTTVGMSTSNTLEAVFDKCEFMNNYANSYTVLNISESAPINCIIKNSLVAKNTTNTKVGIFQNQWKNFTAIRFSMLNCTVVDNPTIDNSNTGIRGVVGYHGFSGNNGLAIELANNIFANNDIKQVIGRYSQTIGNCNIVNINHNIFEDSNYNYTAIASVVDTANVQYIDQGAEVKFLDTANGDYRLASCSDAVDAGWDTTASSGIYSYFSATGGDLNDSNRKVNSVVDLGCYEHQGTIFDLNFNGTNLVATAGFSSYTWKRNGTTITGANADFYTPNQNGNYEVIALDVNGCEHTATYTVSALAVQDFATAKVSIYPNPTTSMLTVGLDNNDLKIIVRDLSGKVVIESTQNKITVGALSNGMYLLEAEQKGNRLLTKFIKE